MPQLFEGRGQPYDEAWPHPRCFVCLVDLRVQKAAFPCRMLRLPFSSENQFTCWRIAACMRLSSISSFVSTSSCPKGGQKYGDTGAFVFHEPCCMSSSALVCGSFPRTVQFSRRHAGCRVKTVLLRGERLERSVALACKLSSSLAFAGTRNAWHRFCNTVQANQLCKTSQL